ncbi:cytochrome b/b6 domain-containing protein [Noviherbaspirillum denitrificans]|uniref:Cytochrome B n=1 Tax=Noviherbaspirillum denitrificans TaxID=1968433 RepID=A0A254TAB8_9BURK|nr:cytochrome b/b6 domain-containing protein [Noviherbaspirillum denitrificans]OWW18242.1 cytochrome B [Noviherbaspirillum denitrificans]
MNTTSESPANASMNNTPSRDILVWDLPVRLFHWLMVLCFAGTYLTAESERWRLVHVTLGYTMAGLVVFRLLWGIVGTRYARFSNFVRGPAAIARYARSMLRGKPEHYTGHNPAGAVAIVALLVLALFVTASGWGTYNEIAGDWVEEMHEAAANIMLLIVAIHIAGVVIGSWLHKENLVRAMVSGRKTGSREGGIRSAWRTVAALMLVAVLGFWWLQWQGAPPGGLIGPQARAESSAHDDD